MRLVAAPVSPATRRANHQNLKKDIIKWKYNPHFPRTGARTPGAGAGAIVYDQLARSGLPGHALYELKALPEAPELDFFAWFEDRARFGAQVNGTEYVPCPLTHTWDAAIAVRDAVYRAIGFKIFIIPVLLLPDTPPNQAIEKWATQRRVKVLFGADDLVDRLLALADRMDIKHPPAAYHIRNEVDAVTNGLVVPAGVGLAPEPVEEAAQDLIARQVVIHHFDTANVYVSQAYSDGRDRQVLPVR